MLACSECNGAAEKGAKVPSLPLLERLNKRNEYLISSNHPLKETIDQADGQDRPGAGWVLTKTPITRRRLNCFTRGSH